MQKYQDTMGLLLHCPYDHSAMGNLYLLKHRLDCSAVVCCLQGYYLTVSSVEASSSVSDHA